VVQTDALFTGPCDQTPRSESVLASMSRRQTRCSSHQQIASKQTFRQAWRGREVSAVFLLFCGKRVQRISSKNKTTRSYVVPSCRIRTTSLDKGALFHEPSMQHPGQAHVSFDAARLAIDPVPLVALPRKLLLDPPRPRPHGRIFDRDVVLERVWRGPGPTGSNLDEVQILA
jgi:hypothetical protein